MGKHKEPDDSTLSLENFARDCPGAQHLDMPTEATCSGVQVGAAQVRGSKTHCWACTSHLQPGGWQWASTAEQIQQKSHV
jgi:hypothetical protein